MVIRRFTRQAISRLLAIGVSVALFFAVASCSSSVAPAVALVDDPKPAATTSAFEARAKAGDRQVVRIEGVDFTFRYCPSGTFKMGSPANEAGHQSAENQAEVTLTKGYWMLETELTQAMYVAVKKGSPWQGKKHVKEGANYPAVYVSWNDASDYCEKLTAAGRRGGVLTVREKIALPTEAQWEYAARAGATTAYFFGDNESELGQYAWYVKNTENFHDQYDPREVGQKQSNLWGLLDMHGNVQEWCQDAYHRKLWGGRDPVAAYGSGRVLRGGTSSSIAIDTRCSARIDDYPTGLSATIGFRVCVADLPDEPTSSPNTPPSTPSAKLVTSPSTGMTLILIPAGTFMMGSHASEVDRSPNEGPQHKVKISQPFYMGTHEVMQGEYEKVMGTNSSWFSKDGGGHRKLTGEDTSKLPVEQVSWFDAVEFCNKLSAQDGFPAYYELTNVQTASGPTTSKSANVSATGGKGYRLPTEAEWEYACRANTTTPFHFGSVLNGDKANVDGNSPYGTRTKGACLKRTTTVGSYPANSFGLFDMHGNVEEWCFDVYDPNVYAHTTSDPTVTSGSEYRVIRGGAWGNAAQYTRSARRNLLPHHPDVRYNLSIGFRVVR